MDFHSNGMYPGGRPSRSSCEALWLPYSARQHVAPDPGDVLLARALRDMPIVAEGTLGVLETDNDVGGELFGNCRVRATSDVGEVSAVLELTLRPRRMLDALPVSDVIASAVRIGFVTENLRVNMLLHDVIDTLSVGGPSAPRTRYGPDLPAARVVRRMMRRGLFVTALLTLLFAGLCGCSTTSSAPEPPPAVHGNDASPSGAAEPMGKSAPVRLRIPEIAVDAALMDLGLQGDGTMEVPPDGIRAGWYTGAPTPGELGPAVIAGHVDWAGHPGVFNRLHTLGPGDEIIVNRADGTAAVFRVTRLEQFPKNAFASSKVYGDIDHAGLRLITCGGSFDPQLHSYDDNVVVFAELADGRPSS